MHVIDAPVSGGFMGAHDGTLALMVGGSDEAVAVARPALERLGTLVAHLGPIGAGTRAKLARNLITFASYAAVGEANRLAEAAGVDLALLGEVVRHSDRVTGGPGAIMLRDTAAAMAPTTACARSSSTPAASARRTSSSPSASARTSASTCPSPAHALDSWAPHSASPTRNGARHERTDDDRRARGKDLMKQVYGWDIDQVQGPFVESTVDHLFGEVWARGSSRSRNVA